MPDALIRAFGRDLMALGGGLLVLLGVSIVACWACHDSGYSSGFRAGFKEGAREESAKTQKIIEAITKPKEQP